MKQKEIVGEKSYKTIMWMDGWIALLGVVVVPPATTKEKITQQPLP
jgi:hypothetical protein